MAKNQYIKGLNDLGQSVWYDNLSRDVLLSGKLGSLLDSGVSGLTSNPTIFKKAIADSSDYDKSMWEFAQRGLSTEAVCEELMVTDVAQAADLLRPVYDQTKGADGYASIEVSPFLAQDTKGTIEAGKRLWSKLARPNIMIKVPATPEGLPAVQALLEEGINVNITLIFSVTVHQQVIEAYLNALEARHKKGQPVNSIASVASFFVSRVDAIVEKCFEKLVKEGKAKETSRDQFYGKVGIANSKLAYALYEQIFGGPQYAPLKKAGAMVQRPLWASTGTKNPAFSPLLYVEELAGKDTVNTMPPATVEALLKGGTIEPRLHQGLDDAKKVIGSLTQIGIPFEQLLKELQTDGVKLFADAYRELLESIEKKKAALEASSAHVR